MATKLGAGTVAIVTAGFYAIPFLQGLSKGLQEGNLVESLTDALSDPTKTVDVGEPIELPKMR